VSPRELLRLRRLVPDSRIKMSPGRCAKLSKFGTTNRTHAKDFKRRDQ